MNHDIDGEDQLQMAVVRSFTYRMLLTKIYNDNDNNCNNNNNGNNNNILIRKLYIAHVVQELELRRPNFKSKLYDNYDN